MSPITARVVAPRSRSAARATGARAAGPNSTSAVSASRRARPGRRVKGWGMRPPPDRFIRPGRASSDPRRRAPCRRYRSVLKLGKSGDPPRASPRPAGIVNGVATDGGQDASMDSRSEHRFSWWQQGVLLFDDAYEWTDDRAECVEAASTGAWLGQSRSGGATYVSPGGAVFGSVDAPLTVEVSQAPPPGEPDAESVGEFDLVLPSGRLILEESGGGSRRTTVELPAGEWRARWSGFGEAAAEALPHEQR